MNAIILYKRMRTLNILNNIYIELLGYTKNISRQKIADCENKEAAEGPLRISVNHINPGWEQGIPSQGKQRQCEAYW